MEPVYIIKIGGNIIDNESKLQLFLREFALVPGKKILVHGGGKLATDLANKLGIPQQMIDGRRITDAETLKVVTMVYAGYINKNIVARLQAEGKKAIGLCGADGNLVQAHKRIHSSIDYGFAGDVDLVNTEMITTLLDQDFTIVVAPITHNQKGQLLNTNADTMAQEISRALGNKFEPILIYSFEKNGVLMNAEDDDSVIARLDQDSYMELKSKKVISAGMIPKLDNAFFALNHGVKKVIIGKAEEINKLINGEAGTTIKISASE